MNLMNLMKRKGVRRTPEKNMREFFYFGRYGMLFLGSLRFICFIKSGFGWLYAVFYKIYQIRRPI